MKKFLIILLLIPMLAWSGAFVYYWVDYNPYGSTVGYPAGAGNGTSINPQLRHFGNGDSLGVITINDGYITRQLVTFPQLKRWYFPNGANSSYILNQTTTKQNAGFRIAQRSYVGTLTNYGLMLDSMALAVAEPAGTAQLTGHDLVLTKYGRSTFILAYDATDTSYSVSSGTKVKFPTEVRFSATPTNPLSPVRLTDLGAYARTDSALRVNRNLFDVPNKQTARNNLVVPGLATNNTLTGTNTFNNSSSFPISLERTAGNSVGLQLARAGLARFQLYIDNTAESGSNAGSNLILRSLTDAGAAISNVFTVARSTAILTFTNSPLMPTPSANDNSTKGATTAYVDAALLNATRGRLVMSANVTAILNYDYLNATSTQYSMQVPTTTGFATDGSKLITGLATGTGGIKVTCPSGYVIQTPSGNVTPVTGSATITQNQKFQLIPTGTNTYYLQPLNGTITVL